MSRLLPKSRVIEIHARMVLPVDATTEQIDEWVASEFGRGGIGKDNPLYNEGLDLVEDPTLQDTGLHLHESVTCVKADERGTRYQTQRRLKPEPYTGPTAQEQIFASIQAARAPVAPTSAEGGKEG